MRIGYAIYETTLGKILIEYDNENIVGLFRVKEDPKDFGIKNQLTELVYKEITEYLEGKRKEFTFPFKLSGTPFQKSVWKALCDIPYGETRSYKEIAIAIGNPKACRAVGLANNKNPISIAVPCHRVIGSDGKMVGYGGGLDMKITLLELEKKNK